MTQTNSEPDWKAIAEDRAQTIDDLCNRAWGAVYGGEHETEWEYPAQAIRHLIQAYLEQKRLRADEHDACKVPETRSYAHAQKASNLTREK